ncbi:Mannosyltransferase [Psidium guajava]|nr:Mannosyltransferase [Psidium guajava]
MNMATISSIGSLHGGSRALDSSTAVSVISLASSMNGRGRRAKHHQDPDFCPQCPRQEHEEVKEEAHAGSLGGLEETASSPA